MLDGDGVWIPPKRSNATLLLSSGGGLWISVGLLLGPLLGFWLLAIGTLIRAHSRVLVCGLCLHTVTLFCSRFSFRMLLLFASTCCGCRCTGPPLPLSASLELPAVRALCGWCRVCNALGPVPSPSSSWLLLLELRCWWVAGFSLTANVCRQHLLCIAVKLTFLCAAHDTSAITFTFTVTVTVTAAAAAVAVAFTDAIVAVTVLTGGLARRLVGSRFL